MNRSCDDPEGGFSVRVVIKYLKFVFNDEDTNQLSSGLDTALKFTVQVKIK